MARPKLPEDAIEFAKKLAAEGIASGSVKYPDGMEVTWSKTGVVSNAPVTPLEEWKAKRNAAS